MESLQKVQKDASIVIHFDKTDLRVGDNFVPNIVYYSRS